MGGVAWTIRNQRKYEVKRDQEHKEDIAMQYRPILIFKRHNDINGEDIKTIVVNVKENFFKMELFLLNLGRGEGHDISIGLIHEYNVLYSKKYSVIAVGGYIKAILEIPNSSMLKQNYLNSTLQIACKYNDLYGNSYVSSVILQLSALDIGDYTCKYSVKDLQNYKYEKK